MTALAPSAPACLSISSKASLRVCSQRLLNSEILPPIMVCKPAPMVPTMERERTTMPRTTPRLRVTRQPGSSKAVVTFSWGTMRAPGKTIDFDHRRILDDDAFLQLIVYPHAGGAVDGGLRGGAAHGDDPGFVEEEFGAQHGGIEGQAVVRGEGVSQRDV